MSCALSKSAGLTFPVIIVTVNATMADAIEALKQGAYEYIRKPFDLGELERIVARAMDRRLLIDENRYLHSGAEGALRL